MDKNLKLMLAPIARLIENPDVTKIYTVVVNNCCSEIWFYANKKWSQAINELGGRFLLGENYVRSLVLRLATIGSSLISEDSCIFECELGSLGFNGTLILKGNGMQNSGFLLNRIVN